MKRRRHTPEQIARKLREADRMLAEGGGDHLHALTVPLHRELKRGTLRGILADAGLSVEELGRLL